MGLFDIVKEKVSELLSGAGDKVTELTGAELPGTEVVDQVSQSTGDLAETAQGVTDTATDTATGAVQDLTGTATDAIPDVLK
jgi:hypothetical protein